MANSVGPVYRDGNKLRGAAKVAVPDGSDPYWEYSPHSFAAYIRQQESHEIPGTYEKRLQWYVDGCKPRIGQDCESIPNIDWSDREVNKLPASVTIRLDFMEDRDGQYLNDYDKRNIPSGTVSAEDCNIEYHDNPLFPLKAGITIPYSYGNISLGYNTYYSSADGSLAYNHWWGRWEISLTYTDTLACTTQTGFKKFNNLPPIIYTPIVPTPIGHYRGAIILDTIPFGYSYSGKWNIMYVQGADVE